MLRILLITMMFVCAGSGCAFDPEVGDEEADAVDLSQPDETLDPSALEIAPSEAAAESQAEELQWLDGAAARRPPPGGEPHCSWCGNVYRCCVVVEGQWECYPATC